MHCDAEGRLHFLLTWTNKSYKLRLITNSREQDPCEASIPSTSQEIPRLSRRSGFYIEKVLLVLMRIHFTKRKIHVHCCRQLTQRTEKSVIN